MPRIAGVDKRQALVRSGVGRLRCVSERIDDVARGCVTGERFQMSSWPSRKKIRLGYCSIFGLGSKIYRIISFLFIFNISYIY
jgi:hypothetical protein